MAAKKAAKKTKEAPQEEVVETAEEEVEETAEETDTSSEFEVSSPEIARPKELPLVVKPKGGAWKNDEQARYAQVVNAYAYKNPEKWENNLRDPQTGKEIPDSSKKAVLLRQLSEIGENPEAVYKYMGNDGNVQYRNEALQNILEG